MQTLFPNRAHDVGIPDGLSVNSNSSVYTGNTSIYTGSNSSEDITTPESRYSWRPHVTLTFAQSIDAKIAGQGGKQLALSGKESLVMTHWIRTMHDAILVGIGTALNDDPQLNTRHLPAMTTVPGYEHKYHLPRPTILDVNLRLKPTCKLLKNYKAGTGRRPWIFASKPKNQNDLDEWWARKEALKTAGAKVYVVAATDGYISLSDFLKTLKTLGIRSLMVEGGAKIIQSFLRETHPGLDGKAIPIVDNIIITVAPKIVGADGVGYDCDLTTQLGQLNHIKTELFGRDTVMTFKFKND
ncbi:dihydrofolate reductase-like domain-containing protein [Irpex rosettiformis]|uniref:Dihydrofolate reductase-like domain-containing protein n=1 Tax=Irpex rosettiformis TaxID=378272 RepID=A0ACB8UJM8_9APHY|nr:dihydrofolate reductase-like domain-containing protein [Irpex rosettiformis]